MPRTNIKQYFKSPVDNKKIGEELSVLIKYDKSTIKKYVLWKRIQYMCKNHDKTDYNGIECVIDKNNRAKSDTTKIYKTITDFSSIKTKEDLSLIYDNYFKSKEDKIKEDK